VWIAGGRLDARLDESEKQLDDIMQTRPAPERITKLKQALQLLDQFELAKAFLLSPWNHLVELAFDSGSRIRLHLRRPPRVDAPQADEPLTKILAGGGGCLSFVQGSGAAVEGSWAIVEVNGANEAEDGGEVNPF